MIKKIAFFIIVILILIAFYKVNEKNYEKNVEIRSHIVNHPNNLPNKEISQISSFWFQNTKADYYRIRAVNYIWSNAFYWDYKYYLYEILNLITDLNPYFEKPYMIAQLLIPWENQRYENFSDEKIEENLENTIKLWEKWIKNFCNMEKVKLIEEEFNLYKIWTEEKYKNPCKSYKIPYYLAFTYYQYKNDPINAAKYYKIASAVEWSVEWAKVMSAIMQWKWWEREKSYFMFLNIAKYIESENEACTIFGQELENLWYAVFSEWYELDTKTIKTIEDIRKQAFSWESEDENGYNDDTKCSTYINKATREINLEYVERANTKYKEDKWINSWTAKQLYDEWYLEFLPEDYQKEDDWSYIFYKFNNETWFYDYDLWRY